MASLELKICKLQLKTQRLTAASGHVRVRQSAWLCSPFSLPRFSSFLAQAQPSEFSIWPINAEQLLIDWWYSFFRMLASRVTRSRVVFCFVFALGASFSILSS